MPTKTGLGLKFLQWFLRAVEFGCCAVVLALFSYFLATMRSHDIGIPNDIRAVEGISGIGVVYTAIALLLLCCLAGFAATSFIAIVLDVVFAAAFIYVAVVNRAGAGSCNGYVNTPYGAGMSNTDVTSTTDGFTNLPSFRQACRMQSACMAVSIIAIIFFLISAFVELSLIRNRREDKRAPRTTNDYGAAHGRKGFFGRFRRGRAAGPVDPATDKARHSYNTESAALGRESATYNNNAEAGLPRHHH